MISMMSKGKYDWKFCSLGGVTRVNIASGEDIAHLGELDKKLWTVLSCPTKGLEADEKTLSLLDTDKDGKIRVDEMVAAAQWLTRVLKDPDMLLKKESSLPLSAFNIDDEEGHKLYNSAKQILQNLHPELYCNALKGSCPAEKIYDGGVSSVGSRGTTDDEDIFAHASISIEDTQDRIAIFAKTKFNGDGIITPLSSDEEAVQQDIASCIEMMGGLVDRSGEPGVDTDKIEAFYTACADYAAWMAKGEAERVKVFPYGENTAAAYEAVLALKAKVEDFFLRCNFIAFDEGVSEALDVSAEKVAVISGDNLSEHSDEIAGYPLARPGKEAKLPIRHGINPAWQAAFARFKTYVLDVDFADREFLTEEEWRSIVDSFEAYATWQGEKKGDVVETLGYNRIKELLDNNNRETMLGLVEKDKALCDEAEAIENVDKLLYLYRDFYSILCNYVIFSDFYDCTVGMDTTFQAGRLFIDQRCCELCVRVNDMSKHASIAASSGMFLIYCKCTSKVKEAGMDIVAVLTKGDVAGLYEGQNAIFYDRQGQGWEAVVTKIVDNPISVGHAFGAPYRKLGKFISDQVDKMAAEKDAKVTSELSSKVNLEKIAITTPPQGSAAASTEAKKPAFDIAKFAGIFAAIGLAVGALGAALATLLKGFVSLQWWQMILTIAIVLLVISGPAMFIAWKKLKRRNLGPLLNANGWAINSKVLVNSRFGSTLTTLAEYPIIKTNDPYLEKTPKWVRISRWLLVVLVAALIVFLIWHQKRQKEENARQIERDSIALLESIRPLDENAAPMEPPASETSAQAVQTSPSGAQAVKE